MVLAALHFLQSSQSLSYQIFDDSYKGRSTAVQHVGHQLSIDRDQPGRLSAGTEFDEATTGSAGADSGASVGATRVGSASDYAVFHIDVPACGLGARAREYALPLYLRRQR